MQYEDFYKIFYPQAWERAISIHTRCRALNEAKATPKTTHELALFWNKEEESYECDSYKEANRFARHDATEALAAYMRGGV